jgi:hypothetical protein
MGRGCWWPNDCLLPLKIYACDRSEMRDSEIADSKSNVEGVNYFIYPHS